jgi:hypothetical protein
MEKIYEYRHLCIKGCFRCVPRDLPPGGMSPEAPDGADGLPLTSPEVENKIKAAQLHYARSDIPRAISAYQGDCLCIESLVRAHPGSRVALHPIPLSLGKLSEIYQQKEDQRKAAAYLQCEKRFFDYLAAARPSGRDLSDLLDEMHSIFDSPDAPLPRDPKEIVQMVLDAKKKYDEEQAAANLKKLNDIDEAKKGTLEHSRWGVFRQCITRYPFRVGFGAAAFIGLFVVLAMGSFDPRGPTGGRTSAGKRAPDIRAEQPTQKSADEIKKIKEIIDDLKKQDL